MRLLGGNLSPASGAFLATALISVLPTVVLFAVPFKPGKDPIPPRLHKALLAFAAGGLLGDVFLHSLPHLLMAPHGGHGGHGLGEGARGHADSWGSMRTLAMHEHNEDEHSHDKHSQEERSHGEHAHGEHAHDDEDPHAKGLSVGLHVLLGFGLFFLFDKALRATQPHHHHRHGSRAPSHDDDGRSSRGAGGSGGVWRSLVPASLGSGGYLNLSADALHNFTDGVALGASFATTGSLGLATFLSVLAHELPHEVADFVILVQNGCSARQAIGLQFCTAAFAFGGTAVGLLTQSDAAANGKLLAAVSGGFVYLATMTVLPELLLPVGDDDEGDEDHDEGRKGKGDLVEASGNVPAANAPHAMATRSARKRAGKGAEAPAQQEPWLSPHASAALAQTAAEAAAFAVGVYMMVLVAKLEMHEH